MMSINKRIQRYYIPIFAIIAIAGPFAFNLIFSAFYYINQCLLQSFIIQLTDQSFQCALGNILRLLLRDIRGRILECSLSQRKQGARKDQKDKEQAQRQQQCAAFFICQSNGLVAIH